MNYVLSVGMACLCAGLGYAMLRHDIFCRVRFLGASEEVNPVGRRLRIALVCGFFAVGFVSTFSILRRVSETINIAKMLIALLCLSGSACVDYREHRIPNLFPVVMALSGMILLAIGYLTKQPGAVSYIVSSAMSAGGCVLFLTVASFLSKGGIGAGDIKLLGALGLLCGVYTICETAFLSVLLCALVSVVLLLMKKKTLKGALPFGPFILLGFAVSVTFFSF